MKRQKTGILLLMVVLSLTRSSFALERANLLLYLPFEGSLAPGILQGNP